MRIVVWLGAVLASVLGLVAAALLEWDAASPEPLVGRERASWEPAP